MNSSHNGKRFCTLSDVCFADICDLTETQRSNVNGMNPLKTFIIGGVHLSYIFVTSLFTRRHLSFAVTRTQKNWKLDDNKRTP